MSWLTSQSGRVLAPAGSASPSDCSPSQWLVRVVVPLPGARSDPGHRRTADAALGAMLRCSWLSSWPARRATSGWRGPRQHRSGAGISVPGLGRDKPRRRGGTDPVRADGVPRGHADRRVASFDATEDSDPATSFAIADLERTVQTAAPRRTKSSRPPRPAGSCHADFGHERLPCRLAAAAHDIPALYVLHSSPAAIALIMNGGALTFGPVHGPRCSPSSWPGSRRGSEHGAPVRAQRTVDRRTFR